MWFLLSHLLSIDTLNESAYFNEYPYPVLKTIVLAATILTALLVPGFLDFSHKTFILLSLLPARCSGAMEAENLWK